MNILKNSLTHMHWLQKDMQCIADNIAHNDLPGYKSCRLKPLNLNPSINLKLTHQKHINPTVDENTEKNFVKNVYTRPTGNNVHLLSNMHAATDNKAQLELNVNMLKQYYDMFKNINLMYK